VGPSERETVIPLRKRVTMPSTVSDRVLKHIRGGDGLDLLLRRSNGEVTECEVEVER
jgi:hypothetical protein